jgi:hypothetical protein
MLKKQRVIGISLGLLLVLYFFGLGNAGLVFEPLIPTVGNDAITIDGSSEDWAGVDPFLLDAEDDSDCEEGTDIKAYYLAKDDQYLYWRLETFSGTFFFGSDTEPKYPILLFYEDAPNGLTVNISSTDGLPVAHLSVGSNGVWEYLYGGQEYGVVDKIAEGKIPLDEFEGFEISFIMAYYWRSESGPQCDEVMGTYDPPPSGPSFKFFSLYSDLRQYDPFHFSISEGQYGYNGEPYWFMQAFAFVSGNNGAPLFLKSDSNIDSEFKYWGEWPGLGSYYVATFLDSYHSYWGGPFDPPGTAWEDKLYTFSTGEIARDWYIPAQSLKQMSIPQASISGDPKHPTISWNPVEDADYYRISFYPVDDAGFPYWPAQLFASETIVNRNEYTYEGDIFADGKEYAILVQARENNPDQSSNGFINRSDFVTAHSLHATQTTLAGVQGLILYLEGLELSKRIKKRLLSKLASAEKSFGRGKEKAGVNKLKAFINKVEAQNGKHIPSWVADLLILGAERSIGNIGADDCLYGTDTLILEGEGADLDNDGFIDIQYVSHDFLGTPGPFLAAEGGKQCDGGSGSGNRLASPRFVNSGYCTGYPEAFCDVVIAPDYVPGSESEGTYFTYFGAPAVGMVLVARSYSGDRYFKILFTQVDASEGKFIWTEIDPPSAETCTPGVDGLNELGLICPQ